MSFAEENIIQKHKNYFNRDAGDFFAIEKNPDLVSDPSRRFIYKYFLKLHKKNRRLIGTLEIARDFCPDWSGKEILEIGCGHGLYSIEFMKLGASATMVDYSEQMLRIAKTNVEDLGFSSKATIKQADLRNFQPDKAYDLVFLTGVTDYLPKSSLKSLGKVVYHSTKDHAILSFPKKYDFMSLLRWMWLTLFKKLKLSYFRWNEIIAFAQDNGFTITHVAEMPCYYIVGFSKSHGGGNAPPLPKKWRISH